jgi:hypothetical protein
MEHRWLSFVDPAGTKMSNTIAGPVFVAGLERSGTSLLYALLASHSNIAMTRRTNMWRYFYGQYGDLSDPGNLDRCVDMMMRYKRLVKLKPDPERIRREFKTGEPSYPRLFALLEEHHAERVGKPRWGDKSLNTERYADPIFDAYPGSRILHMIRDPRDRYASVETRWGSRRGGSGTAVGEWLRSAHLASSNSDRYPDQYLVVRYETLASDPEQTVRKICAFIGEPFEPTMFTMEGATSFRDQGSNSSYGARAVGEISTASIGRYRTVLSPTQIKFFDAVAGRRMRGFDYDRDDVPLSLREGLHFAAITLPLESARLAGWRVRSEFRSRRRRTVPHYRLVSEMESA